MIYLLSIAWVVCGVVSYVVGKKMIKDKYIGWSIADRAVWIFCCLFGLVTLTVVLLLLLITCKSWDKPAKW